VETNARRISRLRVQDDGSLTDREIYGPPDLGGFPDGFAFDAHGNLWITLILNEKLIALTPEGEVLTLLDDGNPEAFARYET
ncbi:SMP-30/gluconolactonase/LRE family protein, partial [Paraburkholderia sp. SIMBA_030]